MSQFVSVAGMQPLRQAAAEGHFEEVKKLSREKGANVNEAGPGTGRTALHWGAMVHSVEIVSYLINAKGALVDPLDSEGDTPLNVCIQASFSSLGKKLAVIETFLAHGSDPTLENNRGQSPLMNLIGLRDKLAQTCPYQLRNLNALIARIKQKIYVEAHERSLSLCIHPNGQVIPDPRAYNVPVPLRHKTYVPQLIQGMGNSLRFR